MGSPLFSEWKLEPVSPLSSEESQVCEDVVLYGVTPPHHALDIKQFDVQCETKFELASKLLDDLEHLDNLDDFIKEDFEEWIKDEPFSNWLEEKMLPTIFDEVQPPVCFNTPKYDPLLVPDTPSLLREFENVFDAVEMARGTLTPPQSPPYESQPTLTKLEPLVAQSYQQQAHLPLVHYPPAVVPQNDVAQELAIVDELIRTRVQDLINYPSSPGSASFSSGSSNFGDCSSDDPEWIPETVECSSPSLDDFAEKTASRKRSKPYSRAPPEDKKVRKKEQNKNAATRYRIKKKAEVEVVLEEERILIKARDDLEDKVSDLQREIKYLKGLMRDLFKAKGLIN